MFHSFHFIRYFNFSLSRYIYTFIKILFKIYFYRSSAPLNCCSLSLKRLQIVSIQVNQCLELGELIRLTSSNSSYDQTEILKPFIEQWPQNGTRHCYVYTEILRLTWTFGPLRHFWWLKIHFQILMLCSVCFFPITMFCSKLPISWNNLAGFSKWHKDSNALSKLLESGEVRLVGNVKWKPSKHFMNFWRVYETTKFCAEKATKAK